MRRIALLALLIPLQALAQEAPRQTEVLVLNSAATELTRSEGRGAVEIQNLGPNAIFCAFTSAGAVVNKARQILPDASWSLDLKSPVKVYCIAATADQVTGNATIVTEIH